MSKWHSLLFLLVFFPQRDFCCNFSFSISSVVQEIKLIYRSAVCELDLWKSSRELTGVNEIHPGIVDSDLDAEGRLCLGMGEEEASDCTLSLHPVR